jgi:hypothetical protein
MYSLNTAGFLSYKGTVSRGELFFFRLKKLNGTHILAIIYRGDNFVKVTVRLLRLRKTLHSSKKTFNCNNNN